MDLSNLPASTVTPVVTGSSMSSLSDLHFNLSSLLKTTQLRIALIQKNKRSLESVTPLEGQAMPESVTRESSVEIPSFIHPPNHIDYIESEPILEGDYSKVKVTSQVPLQQYMTYMEQYLRNINEEDLQFLASSGSEDIKPYIMPPLGKHYLEQWAEEDGTILDGALPPDTKHLTHKEYHQMDDVVYGGDVYFGPLWERIMTAFLEDQTGEASSAFEKELGEGQGLPSLKDRTKTELLELEELVKLELIHLGLLTDPIEIRAGGSDEISLEMERLQTQLREQAQVNKLRKEIVYKKAKSWMAWQEYNTLVDEMNKQIENVFNRRFKQSKKQQKQKPIKDSVDTNSTSVLRLIEKRRRLLSELGCYFEKHSLPEHSIFDS